MDLFNKRRLCSLSNIIFSILLKTGILSTISEHTKRPTLDSAPEHFTHFVCRISVLTLEPVFDGWELHPFLHYPHFHNGYNVNASENQNR